MKYLILSILFLSSVCQAQLIEDTSPSTGKIQSVPLFNSHVRSGGDATIELWTTPSNLTDTGPARILTISQDAGNRNITIGQSGDTYEVRLRSDKSDNNGLPSVKIGNVVLERTHLVLTIKSTGHYLWINGERNVLAEESLDHSNWDSTLSLRINDEMDGGRPYNGQIHSYALWDTALSDQQIQDRFNGDDIEPPSDELEIDLGPDQEIWAGTALTVNLVNTNWNYNWTVPKEVHISSTSTTSPTITFEIPGVFPVVVSAEYQGKSGSDITIFTVQRFNHPLVNSNLTVFVVVGTNGFPTTTGNTFRTTLTNYWGSVKVERSSDLKSWNTLMTVTNERPYLMIMDVNTTREKYYRAVKP